MPSHLPRATQELRARHPYGENAALILRVSAQRQQVTIA